MRLVGLIFAEIAMLFVALWLPYWLAKRGVWRAVSMVVGWAALLCWFGVFAFWVPWEILPRLLDKQEVQRALNWFPEGELGVPVLLFGWVYSSFFAHRGHAAYLKRVHSGPGDGTAPVLSSANFHISGGSES